jgi:cell division protein FtsB
MQKRNYVAIIATLAIVIIASAFTIYLLSDNSTVVDDQLQLQVAELVQANAALETRITTLEAKIDDIPVDDQLQLQVAELVQANAALETRIAAVETGIAAVETQIDDALALINDSNSIMNITAADGFQYVLGKTGAILSTPSIPQYMGAGTSPSGFLQEGYLTVALSYERTATSAAYFTQSIGYGTYEWEGKFAGIEDGRFMGWGFHKFYRQSTNGIEVYLDPAYDGWYLWNARNDVATYTEIVGVDFSVEHKFTLEWTANYIRLYVDDALVAQSQQNIPNIRLYPFQEIINTQIGIEDAYVFSKNWQKIA